MAFYPRPSTNNTKIRNDQKLLRSIKQYIIKVLLLKLFQEVKIINNWFLSLDLHKTLILSFKFT